jgi:hypothetical protein
MVKSTIVFFDTQYNSRLGTLRGLISFPILALLFFVALRPINNWSKVAGVLLLSFVLCSAIAVQMPTDYTQASVYGALVGFVSGAMVTGVILTSLPQAPLVLKWSVVLLPLFTAPLAVLTYTLSSKWGLYK